MVQTTENVVDTKRDLIKAQIATNVLLISFTMLFATLFLGYAIYRGNAVVWPPMGMKRPGLALPITSLVICALSSMLLLVSSKLRELRQFIMARTFFGMAHVFAYFFVFSQVSLWKALAREGVLLSSGSIYASMLYGFTWIHAGHVALALILFGYCQYLFLKGEEEVLRRIMIVRAGETFWHFLLVIWVLMFIFLFYL